MVLNLNTFGVIWNLRGRELPTGMLFALAMTLYSFGRFFISFVREEQIWALGIQQTQIVAIIAFIAGLAAVAWLFRAQRQSLTTASA